MAQTISANEAFKGLVQSAPAALLDVRSEGEFALGSFSGAVCIPILNNEHRHQVGLCYKQMGQDQAIALGNRLVNPIRESLVKAWIEVIDSSLPQSTWLYCWRGGLRSKTACQWIEESGRVAIRIEGGFKALRAQAMMQFEQYPTFVVLGGMTGSGKTKLLHHLHHAIDLEGLARHRGSAFGLLPEETQPTQLHFENELALELARSKVLRRVVIEDESRNIGKIKLPDGLYEQMATSSFVFLEVAAQDRAANICEEYVQGPLNQGTSAEVLRDHFVRCTLKIERKLGGLRARQIVAQIRAAFAASDLAQHQAWIKTLLVEYYDPLYHFSMQRKQVRPGMRGGWQECLQYLQ